MSSDITGDDYLDQVLLQEGPEAVCDILFRELPFLKSLGGVAQLLLPRLVKAFDSDYLNNILGQIADPLVLSQLIQLGEQLKQGVTCLPTRTRNILLPLSKRGWFFYNSEAGFSELWQLEKYFEEGKLTEIDMTLENYFESRLDEIEQSIVAKSPGRSIVVREAFGAHRGGKYILSIPVLLAQADGICKEMAEQYFFLKTNKKPETALFVSKIAPESFQAATLCPLANSLPISESCKTRSIGGTDLNRHAILHGESLEYGTKINSLKAISLVNYVSDVLTETKEIRSLQAGSV